MGNINRCAKIMFGGVNFRNDGRYMRENEWE